MSRPWTWRSLDVVNVGAGPEPPGRRLLVQLRGQVPAGTPVVVDTISGGLVPIGHVPALRARDRAAVMHSWLFSPPLPKPTVKMSRERSAAAGRQYLYPGDVRRLSGNHHDNQEPKTMPRNERSG